jgi:hypothetical protein
VQGGAGVCNGNLFAVLNLKNLNNKKRIKAVRQVRIYLTFFSGLTVERLEKICQRCVTFTTAQFTEGFGVGVAFNTWQAGTLQGRRAWLRVGVGHDNTTS